MGKTTRKTTNEFIKTARLFHGDKYDYSLVEYQNNKKKIKIICPVHGIFEQIPQDHLRGRSCGKCANRDLHTSEKFINSSKIIHGDRYDYSKTNYVGAHKKVIIGCNTHGWFMMKPNSHLNGQGCPRCGKLKITLSLEQFITKSKIKHGSEYSYEKTIYKNCYTKVEIICKTHGSFWQTPDSHSRQGKGCPLCVVSKGESKIIQYLQTNKIYFISQKIFKTVSPYNRLRFDFYLPTLNALIEFNGKQHYQPIKFFHHYRQFKDQQDIDKRKEDFAVINNMNIIVIPYWDFNNIGEILDRELLPGSTSR